MKSLSIFFLNIKTLVLVASTMVVLFNTNTFGQFVQIESILVDACESIPNTEGLNEMVRFRVESLPIDVANIRVDGVSGTGTPVSNKWPTGNTFYGWITPGTAAWDTAQSKVNRINSTIVNCGKLILPTGGTGGKGILPAGKKGIIITSMNFSISANDFSNLTDTLYVIFQNNPSTTGGNFTNYGTAGIRKLRLHQLTGALTNEDVSYDKSLLIDQTGAHTAQDGAGVRFTDAGVATYYNDGCQAPYIPLSAEWSGTSICQWATPLNLNTLLASTATTGGTWSGTGVTGSNFNPAGLSGNINITYSVGTSPCIISEIHTITVNTAAVPTWTSPGTICQGGGTLNLNTLLDATATTGGTWSGTGVFGILFNPSTLSGTYTVTYTVGTAPCVSIENHDIIVVPSSFPTWTAPASICQSAAAINLNTLLAATSTPGGIWSGTGVTANSFNPAGLSGNISITYTIGSAPCIMTESHNINVTASAIPTWTAPASVCQTAGTLNLNTLLAATATTGGTWAGTGVTGNTFNPTGLSGNINITYTVGTSPCTSSESHNINVITTANGSWMAPAPICQSSSAIDLNALLTGAATPGGTWSGNGVTANSFNPNGLTGNISITYTVGTAPCTATESHDITVLSNSNGSWSAPTSICSSADPVDLTQFITGDTGGTWSGAGIIHNQFTPNGLSGSIPITYIIQTPNSCPDTVVHNIIISPAPVASLNIPSIICKTSATFDLNSLITGAQGGVWGGAGITSNIINTPDAGDLTVTYIVSNTGCSDTITADLHFSSVDANFVISPDNGTAVLEVATINLSTNASSYNWNFGNGSTSSEPNPTNIYSYSGTYIVWLKATSDEGCTDSTHKTVTVVDAGDFIPNVFTPNEDGINDQFYPVITRLTENYHMMIFNRWGNLIFETNSQTDRWNGTYHGEVVPVGVYFYVISFDYNMQRYYYNGSVSVIG